MTATIEAAQSYILTVSCDSARGQVAAISGFLDQCHCYIMELSQFDDGSTRCF